MAVGKPAGFNIVLSEKVIHYLLRCSLKTLLVALLDLCIPGEVLVSHYPIQGKYMASVENDHEAGLSGGITQLEARPIKQPVRTIG